MNTKTNITARWGGGTPSSARLEGRGLGSQIRGAGGQIGGRGVGPHWESGAGAQIGGRGIGCQIEGAVWHETTLTSHQSGILHSSIFTVVPAEPTFQLCTILGKLD